MKAVGKITRSKVGSSKEKVNVTYTINDVGTNETGEKIIAELDKKFKKDGAQTAIDDYGEE